MENKNPIFSIKNFRSFGEEGADFELAPITVLTGCNSAGKSSLVKALLLLAKQPEEKTGYGRVGMENKLPSENLFVSSDDLALGRFDKMLNTGSKDGKMELSYTLWSRCLQEMVRVKRVFMARRSDAMNGGVLVEYVIEKTDGTVIAKPEHSCGFFITPDVSNNYFDSIEENYKKFREICDGPVLSDYPKDKIDEYIDTLVERQEDAAMAYGVNHFVTWNRQLAVIRKKKRKRDDDLLDEEKEWYLIMINNEIVRPSFIKDVEYIDSSSAKIKRVYSIEDNDKLCKSLRDFNNNLAQEQDFELIAGLDPEYIPTGSFLKKWIKKFGIGESIEIHGTEEGLGMLVYLVRNGEKRLLADEGYGITQLVSLLLRIDNIIPSPTYPEGGLTQKMIRLMEDGLIPKYAAKYVCVEEPEIHLHPKYQSLLAEMFVEAYQKYNIHFIIETHSEYLIRKLQVMVADKENKLSPNDVSINYVDKGEDGIATNRKIEILEDGSLGGKFGSGFFDEASSLAVTLFKSKSVLS